MSERPDYPVEAEQEQPVIRDKRRIDPLTGQVRDSGPADTGRDSGPAATVRGSEPADTVRDSGPADTVRDSEPADAPHNGAAEAGAAAPAPAGPGDADGAGDDVATALQRQVAERTADLQRVQAEYANYRRRVDRDREVVRETALANVLTNLLPVLDDIGRARDHGELEGGFKAVAESLEGVVEKLGLQRFGAEGEPFDPTVHEALTHELRPDVTEATCVRVFQVGYRIGERIVRPARVAVAEPDETVAASTAPVMDPDPEAADATPGGEQ